MLKYFLFFFICNTIFSCQEKCYECKSININDCIIDIKDHIATFKGSQCYGTKKLFGENNEEIKSDVEQIGYKCIAK